MDEARDSVLLGVAKEVYAQSLRGPLAQLRPLYRSTADGRGWESIEQVEIQFPNRSFVTWFNAPPNLIRGSIWQFRYEHQPTFEPALPNHDKFKVAGQPSPPKEVLDLHNGEDSAEVARTWLTEDGIYLPFVPSQLALIWIDDEKWLGPITLVEGKDEGSWVSPPKEVEQPITCYQASSVDKVQIGGHARLILPPAAKLGVRMGTIDWAPDLEILKRMLTWLRKSDVLYTDALGLTAKGIDRAVELLDSGLEGQQNQLLMEQRAQRAVRVLASLKERQTLFGEVSEELRALPEVQAKVHEVEEQAKKEAYATVEAEVTQLRREIAQLEESKAQLEEEKTKREQEIEQEVQEHRQVEFAALEQEKADLQAEVQRQRESMRSQIDSLDEALRARLTELMQEPGKVMAEIALLRAGLGLMNNSDGNKSVVAPKEIAGAQMPTDLSAVTWGGGQIIRLNEKLDVRRKLREAFNRRRVPPSSAKWLHSAFLAGAMPVLVGSCAFDALHAYAQCLAGGRLIWLPISAATLTVADLLGAQHAGGPSAVGGGSLGELLLQARGADGLFIVVLDGINRAPIDSYLSPLIACYADAQSGKQGRMIRLGTVRQSIGAPEWLNWPENVLLAAIVSDAVTTLPPPAVMWTQSALVPMDFYESDSALREVEDGDVSEVEPTDVPMEVWQQWRREVARIDSTECEDVLTQVLESGISLRVEGQRQFVKLFRAVSFVTEDSTKALEMAKIANLMPQMVSLEQYDDFSDGLFTGEASKRIEEVLRVMRRMQS